MKECDTVAMQQTREEVKPSIGEKGRREAKKGEKKGSAGTRWLRSSDGEPEYLYVLGILNIRLPYHHLTSYTSARVYHV